MTSGRRRSDELDELRAARGELVEAEAAAAPARLAEVGQRAGRQVVDDVDGVALGQQAVDQRRADEAGPAGDERPHRRVLTQARAPSRVRAGLDDAEADDRTLGHERPLADHGVGADDGALDHGAGAERAPGEQHRVAHDRAPRSTTRPRRAPSRSTVAPASTRAPRRADSTRRACPLDERPGRDDAPRRLLVHGLQHDVGAQAAQHVELRLAISLRGAGVDPVGARLEREDAPGGDEGRKDLALDRDPPADRDGGEHRRLEDVGAGVDQVGGRFARRRLLDEGDHAALVVGRHDAVGRGLLDRGQRDRRPGAHLVVESEQFAEIEVGQDVAVDDDQPLPADPGPLRREADRAGGVEGRLLDGVGERHSRDLAARERCDKGLRAVAEGEHRLAHAVAREPLENAGDDRPPRDGEHRLGDVQGQRPQSRALAADEDESPHGPLPRRLHVVVVDFDFAEVGRRASWSSTGGGGRRRGDGGRGARRAVVEEALQRRLRGRLWDRRPARHEGDRDHLAVRRGAAVVRLPVRVALGPSATTRSR